MSTIHDKLTAIGNAIRAKTGKTAKLSLDNMATEIAAIEVGVDTSDANAIAGEILEGKTAYVKDAKVTGTMLDRNVVGKNGAISISSNYPTVASVDTESNLQMNTNADGVKRLNVQPPAGYYNGYHYIGIPASLLGNATANQVLSGATFTSTSGLHDTGTIPSKAAATITPSTSNQTIAAGQYLSGAQTILGDADLIAANIKKGINIFGVDGSYEVVELNFDVIGGITEPSNPNENTIWVNTDQNITGWIFNVDEPTTVEGAVWFRTDKSSSAAFNAVKKNSMMIYPISANQYVNGTWVEKTVKSYIGGEWVNWWNGELYKDGDTYDSITGGWDAIARGYNSNYKNYSGTPSVTYNASSVSITQVQNKAGMWYTKNKISLNGRKTLSVNYAPIRINDLVQLQIRTGVSGYCFEGSEIVATAKMSSGNTSVSIDLTSLNLSSGNEYHVCIVVYSIAEFNVTSVTMS